MRELRYIPVSEIQAGDEFTDEVDGTVFWTATESPWESAVANGTVITVRFRDGGLSERVWDDTSHKLSIVRDWPEEDVVLPASV